MLNQSYNDFEIFILDDSPAVAGNQHVADSFHWPKTRVLQTNNQGLAKARNIAVQEAKGSYILCIDANCLIEPGFIQRAVAALESEPGVAFVSCWMGGLGQNQKNFISFEFPHLLANNVGRVAALTRRDAVLEIGGYDEEIPDSEYENWDLAITLVENGKRGMVIPEYLLTYPMQERVNGCRSEAVDHVSLTRYLVDKHACSYKEYLRGVLEEVDQRTLELERSKQNSLTNTPPEVVQRVMYLENALRSVLQSRNWRMSHPLRRACGCLKRVGKSVSKIAAKLRISVIINSGRDGEDLRKSLESISFLLNGTAEVIVIDEGVSDPIIKEMMGWYYDSGVDFLRQPGVTATRARQAGLRQASAPILFALNAGDVVEPNAFLTAMEMIESDERIGYVCYGLNDETSRFIWRAESADLPGLLACPRIAFPMIRREALLQIQGYDDSFSKLVQADWDLTLRLAAGGVHGKALPQTVVHRTNSVASSFSADQNGNECVIRQVLEKHRVFFDNFWRETLLSHQNLMRQLEVNIHAGENVTSVSSLAGAIDWR